MARNRAMAVCHSPRFKRDRAVQEVEVVEVPLVRLDALEQELRVVQRALRERGPCGLDQGFGGERRRRLLLRLRRGNRLDQNEREKQGGKQSRVLVHLHLPTAFGEKKGGHTSRLMSGEEAAGGFSSLVGLR